MSQPSPPHPALSNAAPAWRSAHGVFLAGLVFICVGAAFLLLRQKTVYGWLAPFAIGCALVLYGFGGVLRAQRARDWRAVRGTVVSSAVREVFVPGQTGGYVEFLPVVRTQYQVSEGTFITKKFSLVDGDFRGDQTMTQELLTPYPVGAQVDVFVNPAAPDDACLRPVPSPKRRSQYHASILGGLLVAAIALCVYAHV